MEHENLSNVSGDLMFVGIVTILHKVVQFRSDSVNMHCAELGVQCVPYLISPALFPVRSSCSLDTSSKLPHHVSISRLTLCNVICILHISYPHHGL